MRDTYLIQDPYDEDAVQFIRTLFTYFGLRPVCFYTDPKARFYGEERFPILRSERIEARYDIDLRNLAHFVEEVRRRYRPLAVIPYREDTVEVAAELCGLFDFVWNSRETMSRFRDKHALKTFIRRQDPGVRVPESRLVRQAEDVFAAPLPERFVLKPNDGFGNRHIGVFDRTASRDAVSAHLAEEPGTTWILEEFVSGPEFHINGQVRSNGDVTLLGLLEYVRTAIADCPTAYLAERQCSTYHPLFEPIALYARRLMRVTGLRRCPFHMEVKVDGQGPCMIDLGARFPSESGGHMLSRFHPGRPDVYAVAAHDYLGVNTFAGEPVDFSHYDGHVTVLVYGISTEAGVIHRLDGVEEVEAMPEFVNWPVKPQVGDRLFRTRDLGSKPYVVELVHTGDEQESDRLIEKVQRMIRINGAMERPAWLRAHALSVLRRAKPKLHWLAHSHTHHLSSELTRLGQGARRRAAWIRRSAKVPTREARPYSSARAIRQHPDPALRQAIHGNNLIWHACFLDELSVSPKYELVTSRFCNMKFLSSAQNVAAELDWDSLRAIERHYHAANQPASLFLQPDNIDSLLPWLVDEGYREDASEEEVWWELGVDTGATLQASENVSLMRCDDERTFDTYLRVATQAFSTRKFDYRPWANQLRLKKRQVFPSVRINHYLAMHGREPVGVAALGVYEDRAYLFNTAVLAAWRRQGFHTAMMVARLKEAQTFGAKTAYFQADANNYASIATGRKVGFREAFRRRLVFKDKS